MGERVVSIKLIADAAGAVTGIHAVRDAAGELKAKTIESATTQRQEWATVGTGLTAVGVAVTGVGIAALKTGIQYNTLQQTTRAALTSLLGSASAANAQMDKLDAFARNSPFSKSTFITAQQQMLAFGVEAKKVIPYLDGVQNAVAAAGGSNADIEGIVTTMSKIQSSSKITATDLMEFGNRGVNAADLIGAQMGKTGAQIRADITAGSLGAEEALDALTAGMSSKFSGAADNVKNTFAGSMDRVKAAWRDFASELATPLVDPNGGGALVDLLNWTADMMRGFQGLPEPIKFTVSALTGLVGIGSLAGGTFMLAMPKILEFQSALAGLGGISGVAQKGLSGILSFLTSKWVVGLVVAAAAMVAFNKAIEAGKTPQSEFAAALTQTTNLVDALQIATSRTKSNYWTDGFRESLKDIPGLMDRVIATNKDGFMTVTGFADAKALGNLKQMGIELASIAQTDFGSVQTAFLDLASGMDELQVEELLNQMPELRAEFANAAGDIGLAASEGNILALAMGDIDYAAEKSAGSLEGIAGVAVNTTEAISKLADEISNFGKAQFDAERAAITLQDKIASLGKIMDEGTGSLSIYTEEGRNTRTAMMDVAKAANDQAAAILNSNGSAEEANAILADTRQKLIDAQVALGEDAGAAAAWADSKIASTAAVTQKVQEHKSAVDGIQPAKGTLVTADTGTATARALEFKRIIDSIDRNVAITFSTSSGSGGQGAVGGGGGGGHGGGRAYGGTIGYASGGTVRGLGGGIAGGTVYGRGGSKSDSINVNLSRGEEVIQEPYASKYRTQLKQMNRGDFVASPGPVIVAAAGTSGPVSVSLAGATLQASIDGRPITLMIQEQIVASNRAGGTTISSGVGRDY